MNRILAPHAALTLAVTLALAVPCAAQTQEPEHISYEMREGDTLLKVARDYMQSEEDWRTVQQVNAIRDPRRIPVGASLNLPRSLLRFAPVTLSVSEFTGPVTIDGVQVQRGTQLVAGQRLATAAGGFVTLSTQFGGTVSMPSNSQARLSKAVRYVLGNTLFFDFAIERGRGTVISPDLPGEDLLLMTTPRAVTAVRGTQFRVAYDKTADRAQTEVTQGVVAVAAGEAEITAPAGLGVATTADGLGEPEALLPIPDMINPTGLQLEEELTFRLNPAPQAVAHRVQVARDAGFLDILDGQVIEGDTAVFPGLDDGAYFVRARAVSQSGIEGFSESSRFRRKRVGVAGEGGPSDLLDGFLFKWRPAGNSDTRFAFQLWQEENMAAPMVDETGLAETAIVLTDLAPGTYEWRVAAIVTDEEEGLIKIWAPTQRLNVGE